MRTIGFGIISLVVSALTLGTAKADPGKPTADEQLAIDAMKALFGDGLTIQRSAKAVTIEPAKGGLTQEKWNRYVEQVYLPAFAKASLAPRGRFRWNARYNEPRFAKSQGPLGYLLLEPMVKNDLCYWVAHLSGDRDYGQRERQSYCALQAIKEATAPVFEYRGTKVTWDGSRDRGDLPLDERIFQKGADGNYPIIVTVAGGRQVLDHTIRDIVGELSRDSLDESVPSGERGKQVAEDIYAAYDTLEAAVDAKQRKVAGGRKVLFAEAPFRSWEVQQPAAGPVACAKLNWISWLPAEQRADGYELEVTIDGTACAQFPMNPGEIDHGELAALEACWRSVKPGATHQIGVAVFDSHVTDHYDRVEVRRDRLENVQYDLTVHGKKRFGETIACTH